MDAIVVIISVASYEEAETIGAYLVEKRLAACANIISGVHSIFFWDGKQCREQESLILLKTRRTLFDPLCAEVKKIHSYSVPEIIALPIVAGSNSYLQWVEENTHPDPNPPPGRR
ncbi:MAG: divalent-cation tolerance protein CutA [Nitrospirae bacterium]|nr:divalent-cation tolerance protein CutA [Candidatus Troglogloeales bacterium]MBI3598180.1 divalent-cation tolerance protein CutA [Candidatus Troglogloeales bacterium]